MVSPIRSPPPESAGEDQSPPPPPPEHPAVDPSPRSPDNLARTPTSAPAPAPTTLTPPPPPPLNRSCDSPNPLPSQDPAPSPHSTDPSPPLPLPSESPVPSQRSPHPSSPASAPAPSPPSPPATQSLEANSKPDADEGAVESGNTTLAYALTQDEEAVPPKAAAVMGESPAGSPHKESALTIAKLLSGEDLAATEAKPAADKVAPAVVTESVAAGDGGGGGGGAGVGSKRWLIGSVPEKVRRAELRRAELGFRVSAAVFCLVSLSVMAVDTTPGWSGDSFRHYNEYRYTLATSVMAFTYSGFQLVAEVHHLVTGRHIIKSPWSNYFNLAMDQVLAYLLLSSSSAALSLNDVWVSRFGVDQFARLINASASMAFLAFIALGLSSIISAYNVFSSVS